MKLFIVLLFIIATTASSKRISTSVVDFGAVGDGKTDDSKAFLKAWKAVCSEKSNKPTLIVPKGKTFLLKPVRFEGPCQSPNVNFHISGNIVAPSNPWTVDDATERWITFYNVFGLLVDGEGQVDGRGQKWWKACPTLRKDCERPTAMYFGKCNGLQVRGLNHINSQRNHIQISGCQNVIVSGARITAPEESPNTDGINIHTSTNVQVLNSFIGTGDDCVAVSTGSSNIFVDGVTCGPGHGISIGSLGIDGASAAVEGVHVRNCTFTSTQNGARIKTWVGGSGYARNISFEDITLIGTKNPIIIDQHYCPHGSCKEAVQSAVQISNVKFIGFHGTSSTETAIQLICSEELGCKNVILENIDIKSIHSKSSSVVCSNVRGHASDTNPPVTCVKND